jgi:hypothetical protein
MLLSCTSVLGGVNRLDLVENLYAGFLDSKYRVPLLGRIGFSAFFLLLDGLLGRQ